VYVKAVAPLLLLNSFDLGPGQVLDRAFMAAVVLLTAFWAVAAARPGVLRNRPQPPSPDEVRDRTLHGHRVVMCVSRSNDVRLSLSDL